MTLTVIVVVVAVIAFVVFIEQAQRRIPVQYARRMTGRRVYGGATTYIPVKVNQAGVVPVIFASSLLTSRSSPRRCSVTRTARRAGWPGRTVTSSPACTSFPLYYLAFFVLIIAFTYFYISITFNPARGRGQHQEVRRLRARPAARTADRRGTWVTCSPG